ncbi:helix-turn-helix domain-containing protein [Patescibacteria group bacterium]|nr:helix-turn-helix domain-containing protein [Patescibacteria group bacterium]
MTQWEKLLKTLGFTESESKIYLISLETGPSAVQDLAKKAKVSRVTTYAVIEQLMKDGLMSTVEKGKKHLYVAESPERLLSFVHSRVKTMEATLHEIENSLPDLKLLQRGEKPVVKMFEGVEGLKALLDDVAASKSKNLEEFANMDSVHAIFTREELYPYRKDLGKLAVQGKLLYTSKQKLDVIQPGFTSRYIHPKLLSFDGEIILYKHKTAFSTFHGKLITIIIDSEIITNTVRSLFELAWESALLANKESAQ